MRNWEISSQMTEDSRERKRNQLSKKKSLMEVRRKDVQKRTLIDTPCESNIKTVAKEHFLPENVHSVGQ